MYVRDGARERLSSIVVRIFIERELSNLLILNLFSIKI